MWPELRKGKAERLRVALFVFSLEAASVLLDLFINGWKPSLAGLCLSLVGLLTAFYFCCVKKTILNRRSLARRQLATQEIVVSVIQLAASFKEENVTDGSSGDLPTEASMWTNRNSNPESSDLDEAINSPNTSDLRYRPRTMTVEVPRIQNLRINGEARPGKELFVSADFVHGTSSCAFQWVRATPPSPDSWQPIEGATEQRYVVTADDVGKLLALECIPVDDHGHHGQLVRVYANGNSKIECDPDMKMEIERPPAVIAVAQMFTNSGLEADLDVPLLMGTRKRVAKKVIVRGQGSTYPLIPNNVRMRDLGSTMREFQKKSSPVQKEALPVGSVFDPAENEIVDILELKVFGEQFDFVKEIELYEHEPSELSSLAHDSGHEKLYFFTLLRYLDRGVVNRQAKGGFWSIMEEPFDINNRNGNPVAKKTTLVFYMQDKHKSSEPVKTNWCMEEYTLLNSQDIEESSWAFCVVYLHSP